MNCSRVYQPGCEVMAGNPGGAHLRRIRPSPVAQRQANIRQRISHCRHLPIEHRFDASRHASLSMMLSSL